MILDRRGIIIACNAPWRKFARENGLEDPGTVCEGVNYLDACRAAAAKGASDALEHMRGIEHVLAGARDYYQAEYPCHSPDIERWFLMRVTPCVGSDGGAVIAHENITDRRRAEQALRTSEARYRRLHESIRDAFVSVDMEGRYQDFNEAYREMVGYEKEELLGLTYSDLTPERWHLFEADLVNRTVIPRGYSDLYEKEYRRKDGTISPSSCEHCCSGTTTGYPWGCGPSFATFPSGSRPRRRFMLWRCGWRP